MSESPNLGLHLTPEKTDETFLNWRLKQNGPSADSNMMKLDAAINELRKSAMGAYQFHVDENGDLILTYEGNVPPDYSINENGELILTVHDGQTINLGRVVGAGTPEEALLKTGGTMTGALILADDPTEDMEAATKKYVDGIGTNVEKSVENAVAEAMQSMLPITLQDETAAKLGLETGASVDDGILALHDAIGDISAALDAINGEAV